MVYHNPPPEPLINLEELTNQSLYKAAIAEFVATVLYVFIGMRTIIGLKNQMDPALTSHPCHGFDVDLLRIIWGSGTMISILCYCNVGIYGKHINPAVTLGLFLSRKVSLIRAVMYVVVQCLGSICSVGLAREFQNYLDKYGDGGGEANFLVSSGYTKGVALGVEFIGTFVLFYTVFSVIDPKSSVRDSHHHVLAPPTHSMAAAMRVINRPTVITCIKLINTVAKLRLLPSSN